MSVVCIGYKYDIFEKYQWSYFDCNPKEYVAYIDSAQYVCTDSFHTTLFSINLGKEFFVFDRQYIHEHPQTSRISNLLNRYELEDRLVRVITEIPSSVVGVQTDILYKEKIRTRNYLRDELKRVYER